MAFTESKKIIFGLARQHRLRIAIGLFLLAVVDLGQLYVPRLIKFAVDDLSAGQATASSLLNQALAVVGLAAAMSLLRIIWRPLLMGFARMVERTLRDRIFQRLQTLDLYYFQENAPGELMARATNDLNNIRLASGIGIVAAVDGTLMAGAALLFMLYISPLLTLLAIIPMPLVVIAIRMQSALMHDESLSVQESFARLTETARESLSGLSMVRAYNLYKREAAGMDEAGQDLMNMNLRLAKIMALFFPFLTFFMGLSLAVILGGGGLLVIWNHISTGDFVAFAAYLGLLAWPLMALGWVVSLIQRAKSSLGRVEEILAARPAIVDPQQALAKPLAANPALEIVNLSFAYPYQKRQVLSGLSLTMEPGQTIAVVGRVGSGKSTVLNLMTRLYDPPEHSIFLAGQDIKKYALDDLRSVLVQAPQDSFVFSATLRANLTMGRSYGQQELELALTAADFMDETQALPQGLDTMMGEKGYNLSGGQRQRLALARTLLRNPPVLLLDDPLSAVDNETESRILSNLSRLRQGRGTVIVSHRLACITFAQTIYVLDQGQVAESGSHQELLALGGLYSLLFAEQAVLAELEDEPEEGYQS